MKRTHNPVIYFEIPVKDLDRAMKFYTAVFDLAFEKGMIDNHEMAFFSFDESLPGITGALVTGEIYIPSKSGTLVYFKTDNIDATLSTVLQNGGKVLYPKTNNGEWGFVAELEDSEGNRIALQQFPV